ncbi:MAG: GDSL-type esterase/lipase family protein, partial [Pseudomonadota bacterium]
MVAIGDSLTAGYGLEQGTGFVPQLDAWLAENGLADAVVVNMGVSGDTTAGGRARLDWALAEGGDAVIIALGHHRAGYYATDDAFAAAHEAVEGGDAPSRGALGGEIGAGRAL